MTELVKFQFKRALESKKIILTLGLMLLILIASYALWRVYYMPLGESRYSVLTLYLVFTQFFYLVFAYLLVSVFADDIKSGAVVLFGYMGYGCLAIVLSKIIYCLVLFIPLTDLILVVWATANGCHDLGFLGEVIALLDLCIIQVVLLASFLSLIIKKTNIATIVMYGIYLCFNVINLLFNGLTNQADSNSLSTYTIQILSGMQRSQPLWHGIEDLSNDQLFIDSILINTFWIVLMACGIWFNTRKRRK